MYIVCTNFHRVNIKHDGNLQMCLLTLLLVRNGQACIFLPPQQCSVRLVKTSVTDV